MNNVLREKFDRLEKRYSNLKEYLMRFEDESLNKTPQPDKWSPLQIFWHLQKSELLTVNYLQKKLAGGPYPETGISTSFRCKLLKWALASPLKFKAPAAVRENIPAILKKNDLFTAFEDNRKELYQLLTEFPTSRNREAIYKHPRIGYINISQMLDFLYWHFTHHEKQIRNITKS